MRHRQLLEVQSRGWLRPAHAGREGGEGALAGQEDARRRPDQQDPVRRERAHCRGGPDRPPALREDGSNHLFEQDFVAEPGPWCPEIQTNYGGVDPGGWTKGTGRQRQDTSHVGVEAYEKRMDEAQKRLERFENEARVLDAPLSIPAPPRDKDKDKDKDKTKN